MVNTSVATFERSPDTVLPMSHYDGRHRVHPAFRDGSSDRRKGRLIRRRFKLRLLPSAARKLDAFGSEEMSPQAAMTPASVSANFGERHRCIIQLCDVIRADSPTSCLQNGQRLTGQIPYPVARAHARTADGDAAAAVAAVSPAVPMAVSGNGPFRPQQADRQLG
jgi:hypothetical protein